MSGGGGGGGKGPEDAFADAKKSIGKGIDKVLDRDLDTLDNVGTRRRREFATKALGGQAPPEVRDAIISGGFVPFSAEQQQATNAFQGLQGGDAFLSQAGGAFGRFQPSVSNVRFGALQNFDPSTLRGQDFGRLRNFDPSSVRGVQFGRLRNFDPATLRAQKFGALQSFNPSRQENVNFDALAERDGNERFLRDVGSGQFLTPDSNPFLKDAIEAAQRSTLERFNTQVLPGLASNSGGGFGLGGSLQQTQLRLAANDLSRNISDSTTQAFSQNFQRERDRQDAANRFLTQSGLQRGQSLGQLQLGRAQGIDAQRLARAQTLGQLGLQRAGQIDQQRLARDQSLSQLGLQRGTEIDRQRLARDQDISRLGLQRAGQIDSQRLARAQDLGRLRLSRQQSADQSRLARAQGLAQVGTARGNQRLAAANALFNAGAERRRVTQEGSDIASRLFFARENPRLQKLQAVAPLITTGGGGLINGRGGSRNRFAGAAGGALSGAALGSTFGIPGAAIGGVIGGIGGFL